MTLTKGRSIPVFFRSPLRLLAAATFAALWFGTAVNGLWLQQGPHPAPLVEAMPWEQEALGAAEPPIDPELVADLQAALAERGFYAGAVDGLYGPGTRSAVEAYQRLAGEEVGRRPTAALLARIQLSDLEASAPDEADPEVTGSASPQQLAAAALPEPPAAPGQPAGDPHVAALQRVLAELGYAPGPVDGLWGAATSAAVRRFEQDRGLPQTGEMSDRVLSELSSVSGVELR